MILLLILGRSIAIRKDHEQDQDHEQDWRYRRGYIPHFALASSNVDLALSKLARYLSTAGAFCARDRFPGVSSREKIAWMILLLGTLFSP